MSDWNATQYLKFAEERTRPCRDLADHVWHDRIHSIIDLGCGPGNSTEVLHERWPNAEITGLDSSAQMIAQAQESQPGHRWVIGDITRWATETGATFDLVFSNAALQWVPNHTDLFPRLLARCNAALAIQMPANADGPAQKLMRQMARSSAWSALLADTRSWDGHDVPVYYDLLSPLAARLDIWITEYTHVLANAEAIVEWYKGTGLRPFLDALQNATDRQRFQNEYLAGIRELYPSQPDGRVLFPFRRLFLIAYR